MPQKNRRDDFPNISDGRRGSRGDRNGGYFMSSLTSFSWSTVGPVFWTLLAVFFILLGLMLRFSNLLSGGNQRHQPVPMPVPIRPR